MTLRVLVVGSGRRVREAALPALDRLAADLEVSAILAKHAKTVEVGGREREVRALGSIPADELAALLEDADLVYLAVTKDVVPRVLARLTERPDALAATDLLVDTPVVRFRHFRHAARIRAFRDAWVAEDVTRLPWLDAVVAAARSGELGEPRRVVFHRSAYAYHGVAAAKALLAPPSPGLAGSARSGRRVVRGRRRRDPAGSAVRELRLANGTTAVVHEPRDYAAGHVVVEGARASASDREGAAELVLAPIVEDVGGGARWRGFRLGGVETRLDADEEAVLGPGAEGTVTSRMDDLKRVGMLRLLRDVRDGRGGYPVEEALEDTVVDYFLEKLGRWRATPLTSPRSALGRRVLAAVTLAGGG